VFVLHAFQKKSKTGSETPKLDMEVIRTRLEVAAARARELEDAQAQVR
jgi:phage-related protein